MDPRSQDAGYTLLEMAVVLLLIGMAAALAAPVLLRVNPGRSSLEELVTTGREAAIRRGEVLYLKMGSAGQWTLEPASSSTTGPLASGHIDAVGTPFILMLQPNGSCMFDVATVSRGISVRLDPLTCEIQSSTPKGDRRAGPP